VIERLIDKRPHDLGGGFTVGRVLPFHARRMVGPFVFFDHMGPVELAPGIPRALDVRPHPHIGLATVTYLYAGAMTHRDSVGSHQEIEPGAVNWMTAGSGITHSERFERARAVGAHMHGIQAWVALPTGDEEMAPGFAHHPAASLPAWQEHGARDRLIAGTHAGMDAGVATRSPLFYVHVDLAAGARWTLPAEHDERAIYVALGSVIIDGVAVNAGQMAVLVPGGDAVVEAPMPATIMALGGAPVGERYLFWNFVSSSRDRLEAAKADWRAGRMKLPQGDDSEWTPLPDDAPKEPEAMS
jgi:redox-sensitive bicupin YhaK (pirin superfamily)